MKANCKALKLSIILCLVCLLLIVVLIIINFESELILNILIGIFGSSFVALLLSIPSYSVTKRQLLEKYWQVSNDLLIKFSNINYLFNVYNEDDVVTYICEINNKKWKELYNKISDDNNSKEKMIIRDEYYKKKLVKEYIDNNYYLDDSIPEKYRLSYANERVDKDIEKIREQAKEIFEQYVELSKESTIELSFMLGDMEFISRKKAYNKIYKNMYEPFYNALDRINQESYHFGLFLNGGGNESVCIDKLFKLQKEFFDLEIKDTDNDKSYIVNNTFLNRMQNNTELFRAEMYNIKPNKIDTHPIICRTYYKNKK